MYIKQCGQCGMLVAKTADEPDDDVSDCPMCGGVLQTPEGVLRTPEGLWATLLTDESFLEKVAKAMNEETPDDTRDKFVAMENAYSKLLNEAICQMLTVSEGLEPKNLIRMAMAQALIRELICITIGTFIPMELVKGPKDENFRTLIQSTTVEIKTLLQTKMRSFLVKKVEDLTREEQAIRESMRYPERN